MLLAILIGVIYLTKLSLNLPDSNTVGLATLAINLETEKRLFEGEVVKDMTMLDALNAAVSVGNIKLNYTVDKSGNVDIIKIDGHTNGISDKYFVFYLNSKEVSSEKLNKTTVRNGDRIEIRFK